MTYLEIIRKYVSYTSRPFTSKQLEQELGIYYSAVKKSLKRLADENYIKKIGKNSELIVYIYNKNKYNAVQNLESLEKAFIKELRKQVRQNDSLQKSNQKSKRNVNRKQKTAKQTTKTKNMELVSDEQKHYGNSLTDIDLALPDIQDKKQQKLFCERLYVELDFGTSDCAKITGVGDWKIVRWIHEGKWKKKKKETQELNYQLKLNLKKVLNQCLSDYLESPEEKNIKALICLLRKFSDNELKWKI